MLNYNEFIDEITSKIKDYLPAEFSDATISVNSVLKTNSLRLNSLNICREDESICPNIYLNQFYEEYTDGRDFESILSEIAKIRQKHSGPIDLDVKAITDFDFVRDTFITHGTYAGFVDIKPINPLNPFPDASDR